MASTNIKDDLVVSNIQTTCKLSFHGAAANSCPHSLLWVRAPAAEIDGGDDVVPSAAQTKNKLVDTVIYASSGVINLATSHSCLSNTIVSVDSTLVTRTLDHASAPDENTTKKVLARGEAVGDAAAARSVTALAWVNNGVDDDNNNEEKDGESESSNLFGIVAAFSDGTVTSWRYSTNSWVEHVLVGHDPLSTTATCQRHHEYGMDKSNLQESIADISAVANIDHSQENGTSSWIVVATASSKGIFLHLSNGVNDKEEEAVYSRQIGYNAAASVQFQCRKKNDAGIQGDDETTTKNECYLFAGSASPRHNKVWVYTIPYHSANTVNNDNGGALPLWTIGEPLYHGHLSGHQDWITCFSWLDPFVVANDENKGERKESLLASSGHDAKIRLWKFSSYASSSVKDGNVPELEDDSGIDDSDEDEANIDDLEEEEGEARLVITHPASLGCNTNTTTAVSLEALLLGHEEAVTSLTWRPQKSTEEKPCLLSSSMDRTILLWMEEEGVWVPMSRVGSAGGILGGSIGASLMGFVDAVFSPNADRIVGHGYGGSIHFWTQVPQPEEKTMEVDTEASVEEEDVMVTARWVADPCVTGHFRSVEDMAWDPDGEYLLTTSADQTTRLWTEVPLSETEYRWVEVGRPQVHGYDMTSIVCIGGNNNDNTTNNSMEGGEPCHRFVSGADEKVLRVFDAPASTLRTLGSIKQSRTPAKSVPVPSEEESMENQSTTSSWRVERAFLPSLGLSNKATADSTDDQEISKFAGPVNTDDEFAQTLDTSAEGGTNSAKSLKLPSERDLGVTTLWPETRNLFGHESELVCLDAYRAQPSGTEGGSGSTLVASSCKARNDVASAAIRLWDSKKGKCVGILKGGHRSTVSTMSFSRDGKYLASSGKDRRICIWKRVKNDDDVSDNDGSGSYELAAAVDSAHKRIVWSVHFCPNAPDILASGSRDGLIKLWRILEGADGSLEMKELLRFESEAGKNPITAVAFAEDIIKGNGRGRNNIDYGILGIGTESGRVEVWAVPISSGMDSSDNEEESPRPTLLCAIPSNDCHFDTVKRVTWRPATYHNASDDGLDNNEGLMELTLASCGQDNGVRIFKLILRNAV